MARAKKLEKDKKLAGGPKRPFLACPHHYMHSLAAGVAAWAPPFMR